MIIIFLNFRLVQEHFYRPRPLLPVKAAHLLFALPALPKSQLCSDWSAGPINLYALNLYDNPRKIWMPHSYGHFIHLSTVAILKKANSI